MPGVLNFTLGLGAGGFLGPLAGANAGMTKMLGMVPAMGAALGALTGLGAGFGGVMHEIFEGDRLGELSKRTATSVKDLAMLEHGFADVGVSAEAVSPLLIQLQKSLGGVNDMGEPTNETFQKLGLSIDQLKGMEGPQQIEAIGRALAKLGKEDATAAASKIVSRGSAGDLLTLARSADDFGAAMAAAAPHAAILARNSEAFGRIDTALKNLKLSGRGLFAGIAEGAAPGIEAALAALNKIDLTGFGQSIGNALAVATQAIKDGQMGELLSLSLEAGFEKAALFGESLLGNPDFWSGIAQTALGGFGILGKGLITMFTGVMDVQSALWQKVVEEMGASLSNSSLGKALGLGGFEARSFKDIFAEKRAMSKSGVDAMLGPDFMKNAFGFVGDGLKDTKAALNEAIKASASGPAQDAFKALYESLSGRLSLSGAAPGGNGGDGSTLFQSTRVDGKKGEANQLERIGGMFFQNSGINEQLNIARRAAQANESQLRIMTAIQKRLEIGITVTNAIGLTAE